MSLAWRRLLTLLVALLLPLQGLAGPCGLGAPAATGAPCASAVALHDAAKGHGQATTAAPDAHAGPDNTATHGASDAGGGHAPAGSCSACTACCVGLALPSAGPQLAAPASVAMLQSVVEVATVSGVPSRLDRPPRTTAA